MNVYQDSNNKLKNILKGVVISFIFTLVALFIYASLLVYTNINENSENIVITIITGVSILLGSTICNRGINKKGILNGGIVGGCYVVLIYVCSSIVKNSFYLNIYGIIIIVVGIIMGMVGGVIGVNTKK